jgi:hypothetical protein
VQRSLTPYLYQWREVVPDAYLADNYMEQGYGEPPDIEHGDGEKGPLADLAYLIYLGGIDVSLRSFIGCIARLT